MFMVIHDDCGCGGQYDALFESICQMFKVSSDLCDLWPTWPMCVYTLARLQRSSTIVIGGFECFWEHYCQSWAGFRCFKRSSTIPAGWPSSIQTWGRCSCQSSCRLWLLWSTFGMWNVFPNFGRYVQEQTVHWEECQIPDIIFDGILFHRPIGQFGSRYMSVECYTSTSKYPGALSAQIDGLSLAAHWRFSVIADSGWLSSVVAYSPCQVHLNS